MTDAVGSARADAPLWDADRDDLLVCRAVHDETPTVKTFVFEAAEPRRFRFEPGQFMNVEVEVGGVAETRSYTISSSPARPHRLAISVKRIPGGVVSEHLHRTLKPGMRLKAQLPLGDFSTARHVAPKYLFLAAGVGATPLMSMARAADDFGADADIVFVNVARSPAELVFRRELELIAARNPRFRLATVVTGAPGLEAWSGFAGRIDAALLPVLVPDLMTREVFCCGPDGFMASIRDMLAARGFDPAHYHEESFSFGAGEEPAVPVDPAAQIHTVTFAKSGKTVRCDGSTPILTAARQAGIPLPSACTKGLCGTCKQKKLAGEVEMKHQGGIRPREIEAGLVLLCCSRPRSDVVIDR